MSPSPPDSASLARSIKQQGTAVGFDLVGITSAARPDTLSHLHNWLQAGYHGEMGYIPRRLEAYEDPTRVLTSVRSIILAALNYGPGIPPTRGPGRIAAYAQGTGDYHDILRERLQQLAARLHELSPGARTRCVVDTAPLLERDLAQRAGLGWFGKNTMLINKRQGSYFFLGAILTDCELAADEPHHSSHCGTCTRCLDACPTDAFPAPHVLDATKCISYLTIELRGAPIPVDLRPGMKDWLFGCDICQQVCPWNRKAPNSQEPSFQPQGHDLPNAVELVSLSETEFLARYSHTPLARPGWERMLRNALIVLGNSGDSLFIPQIEPLRRHESAIVRETAEWALARLQGHGESPERLPMA